MKKISPTYNKLCFFVIVTMLLSHGLYSQVTLASQGFQGVDTSDQVNASGDSWTYSRTHSNGNSFVNNLTAHTTPGSLRLDNYWDDNSLIAFDAINIASRTGVIFSIAYEASGLADDNDDLFVDYQYFNGGVWNTFTVKLVDGVNGATDTQPFGTAGLVANPFSVSIPNAATNFRAAVRGRYTSDIGGDNDVYYIDDIILTADPNADPIAVDDALAIIKNSTSGTSNQIDVTPNDDIGATEGTDGDNYSITSDPLVTANGGTVTEISDGIFEYTPATGYIGRDSFTYTLCDAGNDCDTATVNIMVDLGSCNPEENISSQGSHYITNVTLPGNTITLNNSSGDDGGYGNFLDLMAVDLLKSSNYTASINTVGGNIGWSIFIDYNQDGDFDDAGELAANSGGEGTGNLTFTVPTNAVLGTTIMRVGARQFFHSTNACGNTDSPTKPEEFEDYEIDIKVDPLLPQEIDVFGNGIFIDLGATDSALTNNTNYGLYDVNGGAITKSFKIVNNGGLDLILTGSPTVEVLDTGDGTFIDFYISDFPDNIIIPSGAEETFDVAFNPSVVGSRQAILSIPSNDPSTPLFQFTVQGEGSDTYPDTDGDGVPDNVDADDDNDGLTDIYENSICLTNPNAAITEVLLLEEDFGSGITRTQISTLAEGGTSYCYEDGSGSTCSATFSPTSLNDGEYTIHHTICDGDGVVDADNDVDISVWAEDYWYTGPDHTPGDTNGRMAIINATEDTGIFYGNVISGVTANADVNFSFWALNIDRTDAIDIASRNRPQIAIQIYDPFYNLITQQATAELQPTDANNPNGDWVELTGTFTSPYSTFIFVLVNIQPGGLGNDLAIDDITFKQLLCDLDDDGIADSVDLDNDNDGIPNVVELQLEDNDYDATVLHDGINTWTDVDGNGVHDSYENVTPIDSDGDGIPDYIDLDSDNDGIFDSLEYDGFGDVDIDGDGIGDGTDSNDFNPSTEPDGDGLLPIIDLNDDGIGNDHGSTNYPDPIDDDGDGIPNYLDNFSNDPTNNPANGSDIANTIYAMYDTDNDGEIDGGTDTDNDGIPDLFDTDIVNFGSPRNLNGKYTLFFDGRNDYVEDVPILGTLSNVTLMAWIKIDPTAVGENIILGQNSFNLSILANGRLSATANGITIDSNTAINKGIWVHVAAIYSTTNNTFKLYVNGEEEIATTASGNLVTDTSNFTIGRRANTNANYFKGEIEEVRVFNTDLSEALLQKMTYQELDDTLSFNTGMIVPLEIDVNLNSSLLRYFKMDGYKGDILDNKLTPIVDQVVGAKMYNIKNIYQQTAPLPYVTSADGDWSNTNSWLHGDVWDIADETNNKDWSIVHIKHNTTTSNNHATLGLFVDNNMTLDINNDRELRNSWYLELNGAIDLHEESQLVQTTESILVAGTNASLEKDQQGTENLYTYNYWSSPVHSSNPNTAIDGDETYTVASVMKDGTTVSNPQDINFIGGYNGNNTASPIAVASYWIWKYSNSATNYYSWQQVRENGLLNIGEAYTMKGSGTGAVSSDQNYVFKGTPNNGTIQLAIDANSDYLVGNPYPSAIDAGAFILDNPHLSGTLYFWEHYGGNTHNTSGYQGGYGLYNLSGGTPPLSGTQATPIATGDPSGSATKTPRRYIPVSQGFFVQSVNSGAITFNNDQRLFVTETGNTNSWFFKSANTVANTNTNVIEDLRPKFRFGYKSPEGYGRQLLLTVDKNTSFDADWAYDGVMTENNPEDMSWTINDKGYTIQGIPETLETTTLPLTVKSTNGGIVEINIDALENVDDATHVYLKDYNLYHNLRTSKYTTTVEAGSVSDRFEIVFTPNPATLATEDFQKKEALSLFVENNNNLVILNPKNNQIDTISIVNMLGQTVYNSKINTSESSIKIPINFATGSYIFNIKTDNFIITKKAIVTPI